MHSKANTQCVQKDRVHASKSQSQPHVLLNLRNSNENDTDQDMQRMHVFVCVAWGAFQLIYMWCNVRGGNEEMRRVYLVLCYIHCNTAVSPSTHRDA